MKSANAYEAHQLLPRKERPNRYNHNARTSICMDLRKTILENKH